MPLVWARSIGFEEVCDSDFAILQKYSAQLLADYLKRDFATSKNVAESGLKYCPPAPCLAPPVPHEGQQGLLLHLHLPLLDLVLDLYLVLVVLSLLILVVKLVLAVLHFQFLPYTL